MPSKFGKDASPVLPSGSFKKDGKGGGSALQKPGKKSESKRVSSFGRSRLLAQFHDFRLGDPERIAWIRGKCNKLCNNWRFTVLTTVLTIYALFGDDSRLFFSHKSTDELFNALTLISCTVFVIEIIVNCLGQEDYFLGFFFGLDLVSTLTLFLDLTWVSSALFCSAAGESEGALKTSRAGRAGARASRTVRIIRLMRLVKLYRAYRLAVEKRKEAEAKAQKELKPGEEMDEYGEEGESLMDGNENEDDIHEDHNTSSQEQTGAEPKAEMRVGKKLSDMTTRRVIILVLVMLISLSNFSPAGNVFITADEFQDSAKYGSDLVYSRWRSWCGSSNSSQPWCFESLETPAGPDRLDRYRNRLEFEDALLNFIYTHHNSGFFWQLYWVGMTSKSYGNEVYLGQLAPLNQQRWLGQDLRTDNGELYKTWDATYASDKYMAEEVVPLTTSAKERLTGDWREQCRSAVGVVVQQETPADGPTDCSVDKELRCSEVEYVTALSVSDADRDEFQLVFAFDQRAATRLEAGLSILQTLFVCVAVGFGAMTFSKDANELLLNPIERMIEKMETIKDNPLAAMRLGDLEFRREEMDQAKFLDKLNQQRGPWKLFYRYRHNKKQEPMETVMLEKTIIKLGGLLALGFGEAGAEIIGQNMKGGASAGVAAIVPGSKVEAIIGFCNIRNFSDATEVLKEKVMLFVNQVGEIVHGCVDDFHGAPNKNIGDSFLLVWRLSGATQEVQSKLADMALMSYIKVIAELNKSRVLAGYRQHPGLQQRIKDFRVEMGFGLHCGWAIEGAIGSEFKIDASYLSPNVNVAARLEAATVQFKVWVLISHFMVNMCSLEVARSCRLIDHVTVKGSRIPVRLYTIDVDTSKLEVEYRGPERIIRNRFKIRQLREARKNEKWAEDYSVFMDMRKNPDISLMRSTFSDEFFQRFAFAYRNYEAGEWMAARDMLFACFYQPTCDMGKPFVDCEAEWPEDGPTVTLLKYMQRYDYIAPTGWQGYRELVDK
eukprot:TRINITY_DN9615_c0_g2_i1.p1 TRINITY_DN9615_c0_g2~~TRINITY_DN9615_c0_g2_i1.p1  ORF type:complete len:1000 (-),score=197.31 TRINITY_DN9615_c0_g2_i1:267-3266(-)